MLKILNGKMKILKIEKYIKIYITIVILIILINCANNLDISENKITLKIEENGTNIKIFSSYLNELPTKIIVNKEIQKKNIFNFTTFNNTIELIWIYNLTNCSKIFYECNYITKIDFSHFDTSKVADMSYMFYKCN